MSSPLSPLIGDRPPGLKQLACADTPVIMTRVIKGLSFNHPVSVVAMEAEYAVIQTADIQLYACLEGQCQLHSPSFPGIVQAKLVDHNLARRLVVLANFAYHTASWTERAEDRVQPHLPAQVTLHAGQAALNAGLVDVNPLGLGILVRKRLAEMADLQVAAQLELDFRLPPQHRWKHLRGRIVYVNSAGDLLVRVGVQIYPGPAQRPALEIYTSRRKEEIVGELQQMYCRALEPRRVEDLYF